MELRDYQPPVLIVLFPSLVRSASKPMDAFSGLYEPITNLPFRHGVILVAQLNRYPDRQRAHGVNLLRPQARPDLTRTLSWRPSRKAEALFGRAATQVECRNAFSGFPHAGPVLTGSQPLKRSGSVRAELVRAIARLGVAAMSSVVLRMSPTVSMI